MSGSFSIVFSSFIHVLVWASILFHLWLNKCSMFYLFIHQLIDTWVLFYILMIMKCCYKYSYTNFCINMFSFLLVIHLWMELLGHKLYVCFWRIAKLSAKVAIPFYNSNNNVWEFQFIHILINTYCTSFL